MDAVSELRQRRKEEDNSSSTPSRSISKRLEKLDIYPKIGDDYVVKTESGGYVSVISTILIIILFISEFRNFISVRREDTITIDSTRNEKLLINFNISLYEIPCDVASIDVMDIAGQQQMGIISSIVKIDLDEKRKPVNIALSPVLSEDNNSNGCGKCFGAEVKDTCCNTCEELYDAYEKRGWDTWFIQYYAPQCRQTNKDVLKEKVHGHGCMIWGILEVKKVSGNFHFAVGHAENRDSRHIHSFNPHEVFTFNATHHIEKLSFGNYIPGIQNPLDKHDVHTDVLISQNYYLHLVPTVYLNTTEEVVSNQYSVNEVQRTVDVSPFGQMSSLPGIFFIYDITPFMHIITEKSMSFSHFLVRICAVIGGVAAIARLIDTIMYYRAKL